MSADTNESGIPGVAPQFGAKVRLVVVVICRIYGIWLMVNHGVTILWAAWAEDAHVVMGTDEYTYLIYNLPMLLIGVIILTGSTWIAGLLVPRTLEHNCPACGYELGSPPPALCPECGVSLRAEQPEEP